MPSMRRLVLVRHAKSAYPPGVPDHDRPLNARGRRDAPAIGEWLAGNVGLAGSRPPVVLVSSALRAQQTWALAAQRLGPAWSRCRTREEPRIYDAGAGTLLDIVGGTPGGIDVLALVGHNPGIAMVVDALCAAAPLVDQATAKFPTSGIAVIDGIAGWADVPSLAGGLRLAAFAVPRG